MNNSYDNNALLNAINVLSMVIGLKNLEENREQSRQNDVKAANDQQAEYLLQDIHLQFEKQNTILEKQNEILNKLLLEVEGLYGNNK
jgi:hypothetical protein